MGPGPADPPIHLASFVDLTLPSVAANLALDEAILRSAEEGDGPPSALRFWRPDQTAVVLGASGRIDQETRRDACRDDGVPIFRRTSGGGTVVIGPGTLNVTVVLPIAARPSLATIEGAQAWILGRCASALKAVAPTIGVAGSGDLVVGDRKVAGSAQRRLKHTVLVHASILCEADLSAIDRYLAEPQRRPVYRGSRTHGEFVTNLGAWRTVIAERLREEWVGSDFVEWQARMDRVSALETATFGNPDWVERF
jgi:lipoate-protein ligase A